MWSGNGKVRILAKFVMLKPPKMMVGFGVESKSVSFNKCENRGAEGQSIIAARLFPLKCFSDHIILLLRSL